MILVSICSTEEKVVIHLKHNIEYRFEKNIKNVKFYENRTIYVLVQLFLSTIKLFYYEIFKRSFL